MKRGSRVNNEYCRWVVAVGLLWGMFTTGGVGWAQSGATGPGSGPEDSVVALAKEVRGNGWVVYSAQSGAGDWDLFVMRPDGSDRRNITRTQEFSEVAARFSPDGTQAVVLSHGESRDAR